MSNQPSVAVSSGVQSAYDHQYDSETRLWRDIGARAKAANIIQLCDHLPLESVLEIGAGDGALLSQLQAAWNKPLEWNALEISRSGLEQIRQRNIPGLAAAEQFDGYSIDREDNQHDLSVLSHVLEHVEYPRITLREMARVSKFQVIEVPLDYSYDIDQQVEQLTSYGHINLYTPSLLRFLLKSEGFEILADHAAMLSDEAKRYMRCKTKADFTNRPTAKQRLAQRWRSFRFNRASRKRQEEKAYTYTVLCRKESLLQIF